MASVFASEAWQPARYALSGGIGNYIFFYMDQSLYKAVHSATISWTLAYLLSIPLQQILHRYIVYLGKRDKSRSYFAELLGLYGSYAVSIAVGLALSAIQDYLGVDHTVAWFVNLVVTGCVSYILVNRTMGVSKGEKAAATPRRSKRKAT